VLRFRRERPALASCASGRAGAASRDSLINRRVVLEDYVRERTLHPLPPAKASRRGDYSGLLFILTALTFTVLARNRDASNWANWLEPVVQGVGDELFRVLPHSGLNGVVQPIPWHFVGLCQE
jgi:hypothetical protein